MQKMALDRLPIVVLTCFIALLLSCFIATAEETIRYSCSAQVNEAFGNDFSEAFTAETGVKVETTVSSSKTAVFRLLSDFSDIASTAERIYPRYREYGYVQIPFCRDPLAIVVHVDCPVDNASEEQLKGIFSKNITNWKELGGPDKPIIVIIPDSKTGAYKNFDRQVLPNRELRYDFTSYRSTRVLDAVARFPEMISFIGYGTIKGHLKIKALKINGHAPEEVRYPYYQIYSYVTKGNPVGATQKFVRFMESPKGREIIKNKGMKPAR